jgi:protein-S-isoprenylcysteine O-methyltransferase Ste14
MEGKFMAWFALPLYIVWLFLGFALRASIQRRSTGDSGVRGFGGARGTTQWWASLLLAVSHVGGVAGPLAGVLGLPPIALLDQPWIRAVGVPLALFGLGLTVVAQLAMGEAWRIGVDGTERTPLATTGPFGLVRATPSSARSG